MWWFKKAGARRAEIRRNRPDTTVKQVRALLEEGGTQIWIAILFAVGASIILCLHEVVPAYRAGQWTASDIVARVDFSSRDPDRLEEQRKAKRLEVPHIYRPVSPDPWVELQQKLASLPDRVGDAKPEELPADLNSLGAAATTLAAYSQQPDRDKYERMVADYVASIRSLKLVILTPDDRRAEAGRMIQLSDPGDVPRSSDATYTPSMRQDLSRILRPRAAEAFPLVLEAPLLDLTLQWISPTYEYSEAMTNEAQNRAEQLVPPSDGDVSYARNSVIVPAGEITQPDVQILRAENDEFIKSLGTRIWRQRLGIIGIVLLMTVALSVYTAKFQPKIVRNRARAVAVAALLLSMLLVAQLAGVGGDPLYCFGLAPTLLTVMILAIAYDGRFAAAVSSAHALLVTIGLGQSLQFFLILESGALICCFLLDDLRTRSRLIEVGGIAAVAMMGVTAACGLSGYDPLAFVAQNCLYAGAAGLAVGFVVLGILPFIEKTFRITTSMTLLELADGSQPLLRRLALDAPGTYNHSYQVATLAEEAAEAIGANALLCRVASQYHDIGKIHKADYFVENQAGGENRHLNLSPSVSLLIIIGHVKDGVELAREYNLPKSISAFIQQHHGTTLVEFFYHEACTRQGPEGEERPEISEMQYRYPGPKPRTREIAIVMLADAAESACRAVCRAMGGDPAPARIEQLVHDLAMKRLLDGQFDECDLTMRQLEQVEKSLVKTLLGIYHGRIAYPSNQVPAATPATAAPTMRLASENEPPAQGVAGA
jgi:cyclic-di-AMP phosphodiesterase PgpH